MNRRARIYLYTSLVTYLIVIISLIIYLVDNTNGLSLSWIMRGLLCTMTPCAIAIIGLSCAVLQINPKNFDPWLLCLYNLMVPLLALVGSMGFAFEEAQSNRSGADTFVCAILVASFVYGLIEAFIVATIVDEITDHD
ncbi:MAG TPA: hypothetical protein P5056_02720 [Candidatus Paceibacterota bacterium]|nr:hypothetical protein [Candidatus Paceibacterota bacterium]